MKDTLVLKFSKHVAAVLVLMVAAQMSEGAVLQAQEPATPQPAQQQPAKQQTAAQQQAPAQAGDQQTSKPGADMPQAPEPSFASSSQDAQPQDVQKPVGTAAGPYTRPTGVAGSRPAGAAIAPSKQKRRKSLMIRVGLIVGGAVAVGTVAGLSMASSSRP